MEYHEQSPPAYHLESIIDKRTSTAPLKNAAFWYMDQIYGWCSHSKASILIDIIQKIGATKIVEIGVWGGKSLVPMAYALKCQGKGKIYGIDPWDNQKSILGVMNDANRAYWGTVDHEAVYQSLVQNLERFELKTQVELIRAPSVSAEPIYDIDLLHIDGNHSDITSFIDVTKWVPLVRPGGWIIVDDISWFENGKFTQADSVKWLDERCQRMGEITDVCIWGIWVKK